MNIEKNIYHGTFGQFARALEEADIVLCIAGTVEWSEEGSPEWFDEQKVDAEDLLRAMDNADRNAQADARFSQFEDPERGVVLYVWFDEDWQDTDDEELTENYGGSIHLENISKGDTPRYHRLSPSAIVEYAEVPGGFRIPDYMARPLSDYLLEGKPCGNFLSAVLRNDLRKAVQHADMENLRNLPAYMFFLFNRAPALSWGSDDNVDAWIKNDGLKGYVK